MKYPKVKMRSCGILSLFAGILLVSSPVYAADRVVVIPLNSGGGAATGDAVAADVLEGKTFSNASASGIPGTMVANGAVSITPTTTDQTVAKGYHNGSGVVAGDTELTADNIAAGVTIFNVMGNFTGGGTYYSAAVAQTGQVTSYDANTPQADDGALQRGEPWPSPRFILDASEGTVFDNLTGLTWLQDANCIKSNYSEFDEDVAPPLVPPASCTDIPTPEGCGDGRVFWQHGLDFVAGVNAGTYPLCNSTTAQSDWRLPNRFELESLLDLEEADPALPPGHPFTNVVQLIYWSSSTYATNHAEAWGVHLETAHVHHQQKSNNPHLVMLVRGGR